MFEFLELFETKAPRLLKMVPRTLSLDQLLSLILDEHEMEDDDEDFDLKPNPRVAKLEFKNKPITKSSKSSTKKNGSNNTHFFIPTKQRAWK